MKRLIYSPYVQAFVKADDGVVDVSPYIVRGSVNRKLNQVSTAQLTLRNPVQGSSNRLLFTEYTGPDGSAAPHPMFHPMDPIIIVLTRLQGNPVQVFTGYVDKSPYLQLYPGLCTIEASCTLKRLLYTQWDSSLPAVQQFLSQYGWEPNGSGIWNPSAESKGQFSDGSIGALLFAILTVIGQWDPSNIWIEALPPQIQKIALALYNQIETEVQQSGQQFESLLTQILGSTSQGNGSPVASGITGTLSGKLTVGGQPMSASQRAVANQLLSIGESLGAPQAALQAIIYAGIWESRLNPSANNGHYWGVLSGAVGTWQQSNTSGMAQAFFKGGSGFQSGGAIALAHSGVSNPIEIAVRVEVPSIWPANAYAQEGGYPGDSTALAEVQAIVNAYKPNNNSTNQSAAANASTAPSANNKGASNTVLAKQSGRSPGGKKGTTSTQDYSGYVNPFAQAKGVRGERYDQGVDYVCDPGSPIVALGDCVYDGIDPSWYLGQPLITFQLTSGPLAGNRFYYAEGITPPTYKIGKKFNAGDVVATTTSQPSGLEFGWASNTPGSTQTFAQSQGATSDVDSISLNASHMFGRLMEKLGAPRSSGGDPGPGPVAPSGASGAGITGGSASGVGGNGTGSNNPMAAAFSTMLQLPGIFNMAEAEYLTGKRSFIADQPLFPFVDQLAKASMRSYCSMPNGNFFAFFPDYFGLFGRQYYWEIQDIEILDGRIDLSDDPLITHSGVAGDTTTYTGEVQFSDLIMTAGIFDIFDAIATGYVGNPEGMIQNGKYNPASGKQSAIAFLQKYGARPYVEEIPAIRSPLYELFLAFQNFMLAWSKQFMTTFEFTFMPELFPGGLVYLPDHHLQLYVEEVVHNFDYEQGFTTMANLSAPSQVTSDPLSRSNLSQGVARPAVTEAQAVKKATTFIDQAAKAITGFMKGF